MLRKYNTNLRKYKSNTNHIRADEKYEAGGYEDGGGHREEHQEGHFGLHQIIPDCDYGDYGEDGEIGEYGEDGVDGDIDYGEKHGPLIDQGVDVNHVDVLMVPIKKKMVNHHW